MTTWSCCPFFTELDVLHVRLLEQEPVVDVWVVAEATYTYAGSPKPLHLSDELAAGVPRWDAFRDRLRVVVVDDQPDTQARPFQAFGDPERWRRENHQRRALLQGMEGLEPDDIVHVSDCDEILRPRTFEAFAEVKDDVMVVPHLPMHVGSANWRWAFALPVIARLMRGSAMVYGDAGYTHGGPPRGLDPESARQYRYVQHWPVHAPFYDPGGHDVGWWGWHLSYLGGVPAMRYKIEEAAHPELATPAVLDERHLERCLVNGMDLFHRDNRRCVWVPNDALPASLVELYPQHLTPEPIGAPT